MGKQKRTKTELEVKISGIKEELKAKKAPTSEGDGSEASSEE